jgi:hypothetical protein
MILIQQPVNPISAAKVDISLLLKPDDEEALPTSAHPSPSRRQSGPSAIMPMVAPAMPMPMSMPGPVPATAQQSSTAGGAPKRSLSSLGHEPPAKKQSKWSADEDTLIIELRGRGMKWEDISKRLPGRSAISCPLHYQNYLERRSEWDEDRKNKLARLYERYFLLSLSFT